jgi:hypothetical protein
LDSQELKAIVESDTRQMSGDMVRHFGVSHLTILAHLKQIEKKKKTMIEYLSLALVLPNLHRLMILQSMSLLKVVLCTCLL